MAAKFSAVPNENSLERQLFSEIIYYFVRRLIYTILRGYTRSEGHIPSEKSWTIWLMSEMLKSFWTDFTI